MEMTLKYECGKDYVFAYMVEGNEYLYRRSKIEVERELEKLRAKFVEK